MISVVLILFLSLHLMQFFEKFFILKGIIAVINAYKTFLCAYY